MTKAEQSLFVVQLSEVITKEIVSDIIAGKVPRTWDGIELRLLLADRFTSAKFDLSGNRKRQKEYEQAKTEFNL